MDFKLRARYNLDERLWMAEGVVIRNKGVISTIFKNTIESEERYQKRYIGYKYCLFKAERVQERIQDRIESIKNHIKRSRIRKKMDPRRCRRARLWRLRRYGLWRLFL